MAATGVGNCPDWFSQIGLPNWPMPHQLETLQVYAEKMRFLDASDAGTGKTFPAQAHAVLMAALGNKVCFVMPPKLISQFQDELSDFFIGINEHLHIDNMDVPAAKKLKLIEEWDKADWPDILLLSYDIYRFLNDRAPMKKIGPNMWYQADGTTYFKEQGVPHVAGSQAFTKDGRPINRRGRAANRMQLKLMAVGYNAIFFDEAHALCGADSILSQSVYELSNRLGDEVAIYLMTGTPVPTHLHDVYPLIRLTNPGAYQSASSFERQHCVTEMMTISMGPKSRQIRQIVGYKDVEKVHQALYKNARRVQKRDVLELRDPVISQVRVRLAGKHKRLYDKLIKDNFVVLGNNVLAPDNQSALRHLALQLITCPDEFDDTGQIGMDNEVAKTVDELLDSINPALHKVIVFGYYKKVIDFLAKRYAKWNPAVVYGGSVSSQNEIDRFKHDPDCRLAVINWVSGGAGLNLQVASHIIFYECPTSPRDAKQAIARADRKGQANIVNVYFLRVMGTICNKNFKNLLENEESNNRVVRDKRDLLHELLT
jgi:SNF2 family DNA or RNA helicase